MKLSVYVCGTYAAFFMFYSVNPFPARAQAPSTVPQDKNSFSPVLIAAAGVGGAIVTALASAYAAQQKIKEAEVQYKLKLEETKLIYQQKLRDNYLANARLYTNNIYIPISMALRVLSDSYSRFRSQLDIKTGQVNEEAENAFRLTCDEYNATLLNLLERGADVFITPQLDEKLSSFNNFLKTSLEVTEPIVKVKLKFGVRLSSLLLGETMSQSMSDPIVTKLQGKWARALRFGDLSFDFFGFGFTYNAKEILAAPITSPEFEERIISDIPTLKYFVKEVTLGGSTTHQT